MTQEEEKFFEETEWVKTTIPDIFKSVKHFDSFHLACIESKFLYVNITINIFYRPTIGDKGYDINWESLYCFPYTVRECDDDFWIRELIQKYIILNNCDNETEINMSFIMKDNECIDFEINN